MATADLVAAVTGGLQPRHRRVRAGDLHLHCLTWGADGDPTVLLVHGNGGHAHWWDPLVPAFVPGFRLVAPDLRGHGESEWPVTPAYGIADFSADLLAVAAQLAPQRFAIIAHSMGARAAAWFTAHHPERVRGLALLDTTLAGVDAATAQRWRGRVRGRREGRGYASYAAALAAFRFVPPESGVADAIAADLAHHAVRERGRGDWTFRFDRAVLALEGDGAGDITALVAGLPCPLWVGRGARSEVIRRREFEALRARRPDLEVHDFPGGHHFHLADPRRAGAALRRFLDGLCGSATPR
jgi:pimeloyl-ACP methyl ester carboxylesterase